MSSHDPDFDQIADQLGATLVSAEQLLGGSSAVVHALTIKRSSGATDRVVVRQHRSNDFKNHRGTGAAKEFHLLRELHDRGIAVPAPRLVNEAGAWLVTDWVAGTSDVAPNQLDAALDQMARFLAELHDLDPLEMVHGNTIDVLEDPISSLASYLPASAHGDALRAAVLADAISFDPNPTRLIHGDYWPGNMLWHEGKLAAVIDWEDAQLGDPVADIAGARVELLCQYGSDAMERFTTRYLARRTVDMTFLPVWEAYVSSAALATMHQWGLTGPEEQRRRSTTTSFFERAAGELLA